jgi:hypothetical protein
MLKIMFISAMVCGFLAALKDMSLVRQNPALSAKRSNNIFTYLFVDSYE